MAIIPTVRCRRMSASVAFYTQALDFECVDGFSGQDDPAFSVLVREGAPLFLSSHGGDGEFGQAIVIPVNDVDALFRTFRSRGLTTPGNPEAPRAVHEGPIDQTWGTREFYVDDPDGNTLRFAQGLQIQPAANKRTVEAYMEGFRRTDRPQILACLTDDVEWQIPGLFHVRGKDEFAKHIVDEGFSEKPAITVTRMVESGDVVVAEGSVRGERTDGTPFNVVFCDVFEMWDGKIRKLTSYLMGGR